MAGFVTIIAIIVLKYAINTPPSSKIKGHFQRNKEGFSNIENKDRPLETPTSNQSVNERDLTSNTI